MSNPLLDRPAYFTDQDHLRLLQLMTRRSMAERRARASRSETNDTDDLEERSRLANQSSDVISRWRLVPADIDLHAWQREALPLWLSRGRGTVKIATGGGKTLFALAAAQRLQNEREPDLRLVIVVPTIPLMFQWYDEVRRGNLPDSAIGLMGGGQELAQPSDLRILICVLNSARERLASFVSKGQWTEHLLMVVDECHRANADQAQRIFEARPKYTLGLSATPEQDMDPEAGPTDEAYEKSPVGQALGPILYDFTIRQSLEAGLLTPFEVWHVGVTLSEAEAIEHARLSREITELRKALQIHHRRSRTKQGFLAWCQTQAMRGGPVGPEAKRFIGLASLRKRLLYKARARSLLTLSALAESADSPGGRSIVFHESIDEIEALFLQAIEAHIPAVLEHSQLPDGLRAENISAFRSGVARVIISAKSLVEGFNVPSADLGIIAASSGSVRQRIQSLGRMLRRKPDGRPARVIVLFVLDTEDESIYEKADWESIVGAERNRYFRWSADSGPHWTNGLREVSGPPRAYRPPSWEIDVRDLKCGDVYPGQFGGIDLRVDDSGNLRTEDGALLSVPPELIAAILERSSRRRARRTSAGHLIVRDDATGSSEVEWRFLGTVAPPPDNHIASVVRLRLKTSSGRRVITLEDTKSRGAILFALGPDASTAPERGASRDRLLQWVRVIETERRISVREIFWDHDRRYWLEIHGERIDHEEPLAPLEFRE